MIKIHPPPHEKNVYLMDTKGLVDNRLSISHQCIDGIDIMEGASTDSTANM